MSRRFGIIVLAATFVFCGYILWRLLPRHPHRVDVPLKPKHVASIDEVRRDLCSLAQAELSYHHSTGNYAGLPELRDHSQSALPDSRWPYIYRLHLPEASDRFLIVAISLTAVENQPRVLQVDDQMQVQTKTRPVQIFPCSPE